MASKGGDYRPVSLKVSFYKGLQNNEHPVNVESSIDHPCNLSCQSLVGRNLICLKLNISQATDFLLYFAWFWLSDKRRGWKNGSS